MNRDFWKQFETIPGFGCLKMKRDVQAKIYEEIKDMSPEDQIAYFNRAGARFGRRKRLAAQQDTAALAREKPASYGKKKPRK